MIGNKKRVKIVVGEEKSQLSFQVPTGISKKLPVLGERNVTWFQEQDSTFKFQDFSERVSPSSS